MILKKKWKSRKIGRAGEQQQTWQKQCKRHVRKVNWISIIFQRKFKMRSKDHQKGYWKTNIQCYTNLKWPGRWGGRGFWTTGTRRWRCRRSRPPWWRRWSWWWPSNIEENEMREIFSITGEGGSSTRGGGQADKVGFFPSFLNWQNSKRILKIKFSPLIFLSSDFGKILISVTNSRALIGHYSPFSLCTFFNQQLHIEVCFFS